MDETSQSIPTNIDFATEVKSDRLGILWKVTLAGSMVLVFFAATFVSFLDLSFITWLAAPAVLGAGCMLTAVLLNKQRFNEAAWTYALGGVAAVIIVMANVTDPADTALQLMPFVFVVIVFIVGLLLNPRHTLVIAAGAGVVTLFLPALTLKTWDYLGAHQVFAVALMFISALLAAQVTGELYAVTEWALANYQKERRTSFDLFESKLEVQRSLNRAQALSEKLKETNAELELAHAAAEAAKNFRGQFLANMSHELRTPLNAIIGFSETMLKFPMMYDDVSLPTPYTNDLGQIYSSGRQLLDLINDILDLARVDAGKLEIYMQRVDPKPTIDSVLAIARGLIGKKKIMLLSDIPDPVPSIWADETRFRQVLLNLYSNACKFTDQGSIILRIVTEDDSVHFSVTDTGSGISQDQIDRIFNEFQQAEAAGRDPRTGAGLGLAISRQLLTLMGGRIWVESEKGKGSTFHFVLQAYNKEKKETVERATVAAAVVPDAAPTAQTQETG